VEEISKYKLDLVGVQEVRWDRSSSEHGDEPPSSIQFWEVLE
jgi:hypothetical protein